MQTARLNSPASLRCAAPSIAVRPLLRGLSRTTGIAASVIMPTCNKATYLDLTLATLERQVFPDDLWELIVIDDASADTIPQVLKFHKHQGRLPLVHQRSPKNRGRAGARNDALALAKGRVVIFLDDRLTALEFLLQHTFRHRHEPCVVHGDTNQRIHTHLSPPVDPALWQRLQAQGWQNIFPHRVTAPERFVDREDLLALLYTALAAPALQGWSWGRHPNTLLVAYRASACGCGAHLDDAITQAAQHHAQVLVVASASDAGDVGLATIRADRRVRVITGIQGQALRSLSPTGRTTILDVQHGRISHQMTGSILPNDFFN